MVKMAVYTQKCEQKWLKINNSGGCIKDVLGGKKSKKKTVHSEQSNNKQTEFPRSGITQGVI